MYYCWDDFLGKAEQPLLDRIFVCMKMDKIDWIFAGRFSTYSSLYKLNEMLVIISLATQFQLFIVHFSSIHIENKAIWMWISLVYLYIHFYLSIAMLTFFFCHPFECTKNPFFHIFYSFFRQSNVRFFNGKMLGSATFNLADVSEMFTQHMCLRSNNDKRLLLLLNGNYCKYETVRELKNPLNFDIC